MPGLDPIGTLKKKASSRRGVPKAIAKPKTSTRYVVKSGDSLTSIARRNGTSVSKLLKLNPSLRTNPKYKGGSRIFRGTKVRLK